MSDGVDVVLVEIGGTVGDIESLPFLEAIRQFRQDVGRENAIYIHLTLVPFIGTAGELKTKPTQHSVRDLRSIGIQPDILLCRTDRFLAARHQAEDRAVLRRRRGGGDHGEGRRRASTRCRSCSAEEGIDRIVLKHLHLPATSRRHAATGRSSSSASSIRRARSRSTSSASTSASRTRYKSLQRGARPRRLQARREGQREVGRGRGARSRTAATACSTARTASWCRAASATAARAA